MSYWPLWCDLGEPCTMGPCDGLVRRRRPTQGPRFCQLSPTSRRLAIKRNPDEQASGNPVTAQKGKFERSMVN